MESVTTSLFELMLQYEEITLGQHAVSLQGDRFLSSELQFFNSYLTQSANDESDQNKNFHDPLTQIEPGTLCKYPLHLYELGLEGNLNKSIQRSVSFFKWLISESPENESIPMYLNALKMGEKEIKRLLQIHQHLSAVIYSRLFIPGPTDQLDDLEWLDDFHLMGKPVAISTLEDTFTVKAKNRKTSLVYLMGQETYQAIVFKADSVLCRLIRIEDQLPLTLGQDEDGGYFLKDYKKPLVDINFNET